MRTCVTCNGNKGMYHSILKVVKCIGIRKLGEEDGCSAPVQVLVILLRAPAQPGPSTS